MENEDSAMPDITYFTTLKKTPEQSQIQLSDDGVAQVFMDGSGRYFYHTVDEQQVVVVTETADEEEDAVVVHEHTITDEGAATIISSANDSSKMPHAVVSSKSDTKQSRIGHEQSRISDMSFGDEVITLKDPDVIADVTDSDEALQSLAGALASVGDHHLLQLTDGGGNSQQVFLNTGSGSNQIVTIVPSSTNPNEMSYVLIVEQSNDDATSGGDSSALETSSIKDHTIYDFHDAEDPAPFAEDEEDEPSIKVSKFTVQQMPQHLRRSQVTSGTAHMCNYCNYTSTKRYLLARHMRSHSEERPHKCQVCDRGFKSLGSLQNHLNTHTGVKPHRCKFCGTGFTTSGELVRHVRYIHTLEKPHKCPECDYSSVELSKLKRHMRCHTGERPYQCSHCTYASPDTFKLKRHLRIHTGEKPYECDICHSRFTQSNSLKAHTLIHTGNKPVYTCELCPTTCGRKTDLRIHIQKLHTSDKPIKCKKCTKVFLDRYTYKLHNKTHEGEKCFKCDLCPYASVTLRHLESHMLVHTEQKPFRCDLCEHSFRQKQLLRRHQNLYHNPHYIPPAPREKTQECSECGKTFRHKGNLIRHMALHDPEASAQEKAQALRVGRQKRFQFIDGQQVEVFSPSTNSDFYGEAHSDGLSVNNMTGTTVTSAGDEELLTVEGQDGSQYLVLEVIQLPEGGEHHVMVGGDQVPLEGAVLSGSPLITGQQDPAMNAAAVLGLSGPVAKAVDTSLIRPEDIKKETKKEMDTCFGFDEEADPHMHLQFGE